MWNATPPACSAGSTTNTMESTSGTLIWMVGMQQSTTGGDPSFAAFCLPFQDLNTSNHIAQWTKVVVPPIN